MHKCLKTVCELCYTNNYRESLEKAEQQKNVEKNRQNNIFFEFVSLTLKNQVKTDFNFMTHEKSKPNTKTSPN